MGQAESFLSQPVTSACLHRDGTEHFKVGVAEVAGHRSSLEDAHCVSLSVAGGIFGVFDGHGGDTCSSWVAKRLPSVFHEANPQLTVLPKNEVIRMFLDVDADYIEERYIPPGGSTACFITASLASSGTGEFCCQLQVCNVGDSRLIVGRAGEVIFQTTDHKPDDVEELARILAAVGTVEVGRLDGKLAVSRAFGDPEFKEDPSRPPAEQKLIAVPDVSQLEVQSGDYAVVACDGLYEPGITREEVCRMTGELLCTMDDTAMVAAALCKYALTKGSHDNITVMVIQFGVDGRAYTSQHGTQGFIPGPFTGCKDCTFQDVYGQSARSAGKRFAEAYELRYDLLCQQRAGAATGLEYVLSPLAPEEELATYGTGPPPELTGPSRTEWFRTHLTAACSEEEEE
eukprot:GGOE01036984.1.p1 GENE.GGOE01036984.1~~GGOE01036984.1.p1  ORF type:complete len:400 (+),score=87.76 GGOE01036984.1:48-1247(+)